MIRYSKVVLIALILCVASLIIVVLMSRDEGPQNISTHPYTVPHLVFVSSANSEWYRRMKSDLNHTILDPYYRPSNELRLYHEDEMPSIPNITMISLFDAVPWLKQELVDQNSGLNKYFKLSQYFDPTVKGEVGGLKIAHLLMMKVASVQHAIHSSAENSLVFWVDTDVSFRSPIPSEILRWLGERDVTYIPFQLKLGKLLPDESYLAKYKFNPTKEEDLRKYLHYEYWVLETGLFAFRVNAKTKAYINTVVALYRGGMYNLALKCLHGDSICKLPRYRLNLFLNDIFAFNLPLQSDIHGDKFFHVGLKHGWFAMHGCPSWDGMVWGNGNAHYFQHLESVKRSDSLVTNFCIGEHVFHHFGAHRKGGLSVQFKSAEDPSLKSNSWKLVTDDLVNHSISLVRFLEECIISQHGGVINHLVSSIFSHKKRRSDKRLLSDCKQIVKRAKLFTPYLNS